MEFGSLVYRVSWTDLIRCYEIYCFTLFKLTLWLICIFYSKEVIRTTNCKPTIVMFVPPFFLRARCECMEQTFPLVNSLDFVSYLLISCSDFKSFFFSRFYFLPYLICRFSLFNSLHTVTLQYTVSEWVDTIGHFGGGTLLCICMHTFTTV